MCILAYKCLISLYIAATNNGPLPSLRTSFCYAGFSLVISLLLSSCLREML